MTTGDRQLAESTDGLCGRSSQGTLSIHQSVRTLAALDWSQFRIPIQALLPNACTAAIYDVDERLETLHLAYRIVDGNGAYC